MGSHENWEVMKNGKSQKMGFQGKEGSDQKLKVIKIGSEEKMGSQE